MEARHIRGSSFWKSENEICEPDLSKRTSFLPNPNLHQPERSDQGHVRRLYPNPHCPRSSFPQHLGPQICVGHRRLLHNCLDTSTASTDKWRLGIPPIKPEHRHWWTGTCVRSAGDDIGGLKVTLNAIYQLTGTVVDVKDAKLKCGQANGEEEHNYEDFIGLAFVSTYSLRNIPNFIIKGRDGGTFHWAVLDQLTCGLLQICLDVLLVQLFSAMRAVFPFSRNHQITFTIDKRGIVDVTGSKR